MGTAIARIIIITTPTTTPITTPFEDDFFVGGAGGAGAK
jgi:hypothetical protein